MKITDDDVLARIDEIDAMLQGIIFYIAAKEAGFKLGDMDDERSKSAILTNVGREYEYRLKRSNNVVGKGVYEISAIAQIQELVAKLKASHTS